MAKIEIKITDSLIKRFWEKVEKTEYCWIWKASKNKQGYGRFGVSAGKAVNAPRVSWTILKGDIPEDNFICHKCDNPSCVNPDHLFIGTRQDNIDDMMKKKRSKHFQNNVYYGVMWDERKSDGHNRKGRWRSFVYINGKMKKIGSHNSLIDAARNYDRIAYMKYGIKDKLNFPEDYNLKD
jgi:hypothetical protein